MKIPTQGWPVLIFALAHCSSPAQVCPDPQLLVDGQCKDLCAELDCNDDNDCTFEECVVNRQELTASCVRTDAPDGRDCEGADGPGSCDVGQCAPDAIACTPPDCDDGNDCTVNGTCNSSNGQCEGGRNEAAGQLCTGGFCDGEGSCVECINEQQCEDDNPCTQNLCEANACDFQNITGDPCDYQGGTLNGVCEDGVCAAPPPACVPNPCDDTGNDCTFEQCNPGPPLSCDLTNVTDGTACPPGNDTARCVVGSCVPWCDGVTCPDPPECQTRGTCVPTTGLCDNGGNEVDGTECTPASGNSGTCAAGTCVPRDWQGDNALSDAASGSPQVAMDAEGNAMALWVQSNQVRAARYTDGSWSPYTVDAPAGQNPPTVAVPQVAMDDEGNAIAVWKRGEDVLWSYFSEGTSTWAPGFAMNDGQAEAANPTIAMAASGAAIAVWEQASNVWAMRIAAGGTPSPAVEIEGASAIAREAQAAIDDSGTAIVVWKQFESPRWNIIARRYSASWLAAIPLETNDATAGVPQIAMNGSGVAVAVWEQFVGQWNSIWSNRYTPGAPGDGWSGAVTVESSSGNAEDPQVAIDGPGVATAVWQQQENTRWNIWASRSTSSTWDAPSGLEEDDTDARAPQVAVDRMGRAIAVWRQFRSSDSMYQIRAALRAGSQWEAAEYISAGSESASLPQIAVGANGDGTAVFLGADADVYENRYE